MQVIMGYKDLMDESEQTAEKMYRIYMICWALELVKMIGSSVRWRIRLLKRI